VLRAVRGDWKGAESHSAHLSRQVADTLGRLNAAWSAIADETSLAQLVQGDDDRGADADA